jgi:hypothetical protein
VPGGPRSWRSSANNCPNGAFCDLLLTDVTEIEVYAVRAG